MVTWWTWIISLASSGVPQKLLNNNQMIDKLIHFGGSSLSKDEVIGFYLDWHSVLHTSTLVMQKIIGSVNNWITLGSYHTSQAFESIFMAVLKMFGMFKDFKVGEMGDLYKVIVGLGFALLTIGLSYLLVENIFRAKTRLHEVITNLVVVIAVLIMLPFGTNLFSQFVQAGGEQLTGTSKNSQLDSITLEPLQNNIIDTLTVAEKGFKVDPTKLDSKISQLNNINQGNIDYLDLSDVVASDNLKVVDTPKGTDNVFKHKLSTGVSQNGQNSYFISDATLPAKQNQLSKALDLVYPRYTGHFVMANLQLWLLSLMFAFIAFRLAKSWFEIWLLNLSSPLMGFQDLRTNQRLKEVLQAIQGSFMSVFVELIGLRLFLIMLHVLGSSSNPGIVYLSQFSNSALPRAFFTIIMYLACFVAFLSGTSLVERWTGVPQSKNGMLLGALMGAGIGLKAAGGAAGLGHKAASGIHKLMKETDEKSEKEETPDPTKSESKPQSKTSRDDGSAPAGTQTPTGQPERDDGTPDNKQPSPSDNGEPTVGKDSTKGPEKKPDVENDGAPKEGAIPDPTQGTPDNSDLEREDEPETGGVPDPTQGTSDNPDLEREDEPETGGVPDPTQGTSDNPDLEREDEPETGGVPDSTQGTPDNPELGREDEPEAGSVPDPTQSTPGNPDLEREGEPEGDSVPDSTQSSGSAKTPTVERTGNPDGKAMPNPTKGPETPPRQGRQVYTGTAANEALTMSRSSDGSTPVTGSEPVEGQPATETSQADNETAPADPAPKAQAKHGQHLVKSGVALESMAQQAANNPKTTVNVPEIKVDDSIY
ncbi:pLS20_p028 family conjugation system transmembrane protein [Lactiplantibacillus plantarum]|uniref:pLS20_p028 family conjugation system transmembrane protein n=1 Tax=Lactiplantibacillus plantarum TaxID=1590 RepID=UPI001BA5DB32|nr:hypothetical protein [Lactiplantibacillus plantarum]MBS0935691.1 hypothetical protein [Lactiplantibacillus plantarum]MBS0943952.1 hypothetical protein [Lactiplantibacillus plantarum]